MLDFQAQDDGQIFNPKIILIPISYNVFVKQVWPEFEGFQAHLLFIYLEDY